MNGAGTEATSRDETDKQPATDRQSKQLTKMTSGGQELREHDFPATPEQLQRIPGTVQEPTSAPPPEAVRSGGKRGTVRGDTQAAGDVGAIVNQDEIDPANPKDG
jgi:hypothetical protein